MRPKQLSSLLQQTIAQRMPVLITGAPGVGKSDVVTQAAAVCGADLIISHPAVADPTDAKGLPWPNKDGQAATFLPYGELARALKAERLTVWFLDDLGQATPAVQASFMQLLLARRVNGHALSDKVVFVAATNRRTDKAGVQGILEPVKSRFATIVELNPSLDDWCEWAMANQVPAEIIAFLRFRPELLHCPDPSKDITNAPSPRTWGFVAKLMQLVHAPELEREIYAGTVGEGAATEFVGFLRTYRELPHPDDVLLDPDSAIIPTEPSALYAITAALARRVNVNNVGRVFRYAARLNSAGHSEFGVLLMRDVIQHHPHLKSTPEFIKLASGELGKIMSGG